MSRAPGTPTQNVRGGAGVGARAPLPCARGGTAAACPEENSGYGGEIVDSLRNADDTMLRVIDGRVTNRPIDQFEKLRANERPCD